MRILYCYILCAVRKSAVFRATAKFNEPLKLIASILKQWSLVWLVSL